MPSIMDILSGRYRNDLDRDNQYLRSLIKRLEQNPERVTGEEIQQALKGREARKERALLRN